MFADGEVHATNETRRTWDPIQVMGMSGACGKLHVSLVRKLFAVIQAQACFTTNRNTHSIDSVSPKKAAFFFPSTAVLARCAFVALVNVGQTWAEGINSKRGGQCQHIAKQERVYLDVTLLTARAAMSRLSVTFTRGHAYLSVKAVDRANFAWLHER